MSQIGDLRAALRENLKTIPGVSVSRFALNNPTPPGIHLWPSEIPQYHHTFGSAELTISEVHFTVQAFVAFASNEGSQEIMDEMLGADTPRSVARAIEADKTLGGLAHDLEAKQNTGYQMLETPIGTGLIVSDWLVTVIC